MNVRRDVRQQVGQRIRARRKALGLSQRALGARLWTKGGGPVGEGQVSKWERGLFLPDPRQWSELAAALDAPIDGLFGGLLAEAPDELLVNRMDELEARVEALIRIQGLGEKVEAAVRSARRVVPATDDPADFGERLSAGLRGGKPAKPRQRRADST